MKKTFRFLFIALGVLISLIVIVVCLLYFFLPLNTIKDFAASKLSEQLKHKVTIEKVSLDIFSGIKLNNVSIENAKGFSKTPLVFADTIELKYAFWPIFKKKIIIPEIKLVKPQIFIEKDKDGLLNFSDVYTVQSPIKNKTKRIQNNKKKQHGEVFVDFLINNFNISNGSLIYYDHLTGKAGLSKINIKISNITLFALKPIDVKFSAKGFYRGKEIPISLSSKIDVDIVKQILKIRNFDLSILQDSLSANAEIKNFAKKPNINVTATSSKITIDPFLAIFAVGAESDKKTTKTPYGAITKSLKKTFAAIPSNIIASTSLDLKNVTFKNLKIDSLALDFKFVNKCILLELKDFSAYKGKLYVKLIKVDLPRLTFNISGLELKGFSSTPFLNDLVDSFFPNFIDVKNNVEGVLDASLSLSDSGVEMPDVFNNLKGSGVVILSKGRLKKIKSLSAIGEKYNLNTLKQDMIVGGLRIEGSIYNKILKVTKLSLQDTDLRIGFAGGLDFEKMQYVKGNKLTLKFSPNITNSLPKEFMVLRDDKGITTVDFELKGSLYKPVPIPLFKNVINTAVSNLKIKIEAKKVELQTKAQEDITRQVGEKKEQIKEDVKNKVKEIFKF